MFKPGDHVRYVGNKEGKPMTHDYVGKLFTVTGLTILDGVRIRSSDGTVDAVYAFNLELEDINA